jgi:hypothetical protein
MASVAAHGSAPVKARLVACVMDGRMITLDGYLISPEKLDLAKFQGQKISVEGLVYPGDYFKPSSAVRVLGTCSSDEKLKLLPELARSYRRTQILPVAAQAKPGPPLATLDCDSKPGNPCYEIVRVPKSGGSPVVLRRGPLIGHVFVDASYVYWSEGTIATWKMMRLPKSGGASSAISEGTLHSFMARGPDAFYSATTDDLTALLDGKPSRVLVAKSVADVVVAGDALYFSQYGPENSATISTMPLTGGTPRVLAAGQPVGSCLTVANGMIYWVNHNIPPTGAGAIMGLPVTGGVPRTLVEPNHEMFPWFMRADKEWLYWVETRGGGYSLWHAPVTGGQRTLLGTAPTKAMNRDNRDHIELDETHVYWNARESVARIRKSGGAVEEVLRLARGDVMSFAIDEKDIYLAVVIF